MASICQACRHLRNTHDGDSRSDHVTSIWGRSLATSIKLRLRPLAPLKLRPLGCVIVSTLALLTLVVGVARLKVKPTVHVYFPGSQEVIRRVRMFSDFPSLSQLSSNHSSLSLVSRLQLLDSRHCDGPLCRLHVVCDPSTGQQVNCRCQLGFYFRDWQCHECAAHCPDGHYLQSSCSDSADALCAACTTCGPTQYQAAPCTSSRDTICVDVSFPVGILPMTFTHLPDDGLPMTVAHSPNVFMERLRDMAALETRMYVTTNQQALDFDWLRASGLKVTVSVTGVFLVPTYRDLDAEDDTSLFNHMPTVTARSKDFYKHVQANYCRHPVPDYYLMQLEIYKNRTSAAKVVRCDSTDSTIPTCPANYRDGDRWLDWDINAPCEVATMTDRVPRSNMTPLEKNRHPNSVFCTEETPLLKEVFGQTRPMTQEFMFPSRQCNVYRQQCQECLNTATCERGSTGQCCGVPCYRQDACTKAYSGACPIPEVECARGEVDIFSIFPEFETMEKQFNCHLAVSWRCLFKFNLTLKKLKIHINYM